MWNMTKKVFISQPMTGLDEKDILTIRNNAIKDIKEMSKQIGVDVEIIDSYITDATRIYVESMFDDIENWDIYWLGRSLEKLAKANVLWLVDGWEQSKGCNIELECAKRYGIEISYP